MARLEEVRREMLAIKDAGFAKREADQAISARRSEARFGRLCGSEQNMSLRAEIMPALYCRSSEHGTPVLMAFRKANSMRNV
jgi:hypothetical protein